MHTYYRHTVQTYPKTPDNSQTQDIKCKMHQQKEICRALLTAALASLGLDKQIEVLSLKTLVVDVLRRWRLLFWEKELEM